MERRIREGGMCGSMMRRAHQVMRICPWGLAPLGFRRLGSLGEIAADEKADPWSGCCR